MGPGDLARRLAGAGYTRCDQVEGPGQFALRGGILDVFSPGMEQPVRCEFFDDEIDSLGIFDTATQRRVENRREALLLPAAEVLPAWQEGQAEQAALRLEAAVKRLARRQGTQALRELLTADAARLRQGMAPNGRTGAWRRCIRKRPRLWTICPKTPWYAWRKAAGRRRPCGAGCGS